jgi:hypothetical protein
MGAYGYYSGPMDSGAPYWDEDLDDPGPAQQTEYGVPPAAQVADSNPTYYRPAYQSAPPEVPASPQPATTLIFQDGRPTVEIHNYALIGSTLYALDGETRQEIPLSALDLPATIEANRKAGVDFSPPS